MGRLIWRSSFVSFTVLDLSDLKTAQGKPKMVSSVKWAEERQSQQNDLCAQQRVWSAWASTQHDRGLRCLPEESLCSKLPINCTEDSDQSGQMPRLIWVFAGHTFYYGPNFKELEGAYCLCVVHACLHPSQFLIHAIFYELSYEIS